MTARRLALVTGGCRRLGAAVAAGLAQAGYDLALHGSHDAEPEPALAAVLAGTGVEWHGFAADFAEPANAETLFAAVTDRFGRAPDLLVNGASVFGQDGLAEASADELMRAYAVNCASAVLLVQAFAGADRPLPVAGQRPDGGVSPVTRSRSITSRDTPPPSFGWSPSPCGGGSVARSGGGGGDRSVVNILDQRIAHPHPDQLSYTLAKLGLAGLTRIGAQGVRMNGVAPGLTLATDAYDEGGMARLAGLMPLGRLPTPADIAAAVLFCAGTAGMDRQILYVDGGAHLVPFARDFMHLAG